MRSSESSRQKSLLALFEGAVALEVGYIIGGYFIAPNLAEVFPSTPQITIILIVSSLGAPILAFIYLCKRFNIAATSTIFIKGHFFTNLTAFLIAAWLIDFIAIIFLGKSNDLANEIFSINSSLLRNVTLILLNILVPLAEELLYRGYLLEILRRPWGTGFSIIISSMVFVLAHDIFGGVGGQHIFIFIESLLFSAAYLQGGLICSILVHVFTNSYLTFVYACA